MVDLPQDLWRDASDQLLPKTAEWTHRVEIADLDNDGDLDLLFANGGAYSTPGEAELSRVFLNPGDGGTFVEATEAVLGNAPGYARSIKARDLNGDGWLDIVVARTYSTASRLLINRGPDSSGGVQFEDVSETSLPASNQSDGASFGDVEVGDVDADGDMDLVFIDWGPGDAMTNSGGSPALWLNQLSESGEFRFVESPADDLPEVRVEFSWDIELYDVDQDFDLDILISCKRCGGGKLLRGLGDGSFEDHSRALPQYTNNYDYEGMDLNGDGLLDLVTINDGDIKGAPYSRKEHILINRAADDNGERPRPQHFVDRTASLWPEEANIGEDDNVAAFLDYDSDGDSDFLIASLTGPDRLLVNDLVSDLGKEAQGTLKVAPAVFSGADTPGTLGIALGDLNGDHRLDVVMSQGEHPTAVEEKIFLGSEAQGGLAVDSVAPWIGPPSQELRAGTNGRPRIRVRIHDFKSPVQVEDFQGIELKDPETGVIAPLHWYGGQLWRTPWLKDRLSDRARICAVDRAGNEHCRSVASVD